MGAFGEDVLNNNTEGVVTVFRYNMNNLSGCINIKWHRDVRKEITGYSTEKQNRVLKFKDMIVFRGILEAMTFW